MLKILYDTKNKRNKIMPTNAGNNNISHSNSNECNAINNNIIHSNSNSNEWNKGVARFMAFNVLNSAIVSCHINKESDINRDRALRGLTKNG